MTQYNRHAFPTGSKVKVAQRWGNPVTGLNAQTVYTVESCRTAGLGDNSGFMVRVEDVNDEFGSDWFVYAEAPGRDIIPFSLTKETSRQYALHQKSKRLDEEQNLVLDEAGNGREVDAVEFRKAVTAALSLAATRAGQSMGRREWTKECRHLLYIVDAVLDNALAGLPPVDPGTRSPKIAEQSQEIDDLRASLERKNRDVEAAREALAAELSNHSRTVTALDEVSDAWSRLAESTKNQRRQFDYALSLMDTESKFKVVGFGDALNS
jgi:hypothetical protein